MPILQFSPEEYIWLNTTTSNMCLRRIAHTNSMTDIGNPLRSISIPRERHEEFLLKELVKRWDNHRIMVRWLSQFFHYLDRYFIARWSTARAERSRIDVFPGPGMLPTFTGDGLSVEQSVTLKESVSNTYNFPHV